MLDLGHTGIALIRSNGEELSYAALREAVRIRAAEFRASGAAAGTCVALALPDPSAFLVDALAVWETGAAVLPIDVRAGTRWVDDLVSRGGAAILVTPDSISTRPGRAIDPRCALLLFTSGSTGKPKGVLLSRAGLSANLDAILAYLPIAASPRTALVLPLNYSYALVGQALTTLRAGGTLLLLGDLIYPALQLEAMARLEASGLSSVPTSLRLLSRAAAAGSAKPRLGYVASAGAPLDQATAAEVRAAFPGIHLFNQYGLTEASPRVAAISDQDADFVRGAVGRPLAGIEAWACGEDGARLPAGEPGEIVVRGPSVMLGYLDDAKATARVLTNGALRTGDAGRVDARGCLWIEGRKDGVVKCAGERVSLDEVAAALRAHAGVAEACVLAIPDEALGARLIAFVEASASLVPTLRLYLRDELPPAKRPSRILALAALPRTANGKVDLRALQETLR